MNDDAQASTGRVAVNGGHLAFRVEGPRGAPPLIFSNSLGTDLHMWDAQAARLARAYRVVRYDTRGHGQSEAPDGPYSLEQLGGDLLALLDALDIERATICGLSLGGMTAQQVAVTAPERVGRLVLANTAARIGSEESWDERIASVRAGGMRAIYDASLARFLSEPFRQQHPEQTQRIGAMLLATPTKGYIGACAALREADLRGVVGRITAPTLIIGSTLDVSTPPEQARELAAAIPGSELVLFDGVAHLSNVERPDEFTSHLLAFLGGK